jgi:hypothetical protein
MQQETRKGEMRVAHQLLTSTHVELHLRLAKSPLVCVAFGMDTTGACHFCAAIVLSRRTTGSPGAFAASAFRLLISLMEGIKEGQGLEPIEEYFEVQDITNYWRLLC